MNWFIFALIGILSFSIANIIQRLIMKEPDSNPLASSIIFQFMLAFMTGIFALIKGFSAPPILDYPFNFIFSSVFYALGTLLLFKAAKKIGASEITILSSFGAIITIITAIFFLKESFTIKQALGTFLILISVLLIQNKLKISKNKGSLYAISGASCYALAVVSDTFILKRYDAVSYTPLMSLFPGIILLISKPSIVKDLKCIVNLKYFKNISVYSFVYSIQAIAYYMAIGTGANAS